MTPPSWRVAPTFSRLLALGTLATLAFVHSQPSEVDALLSLRDSITNWGEFAAANNIVGWGSSSPAPPCLWTGVQCDDQGRVMALRLTCDEGCTVEATGTLSPALGSMQALVSIDLRNNAFSGGLPVEWAAPGAFPALQALYLADNDLEGPIMWTGTAFPQLQLLRLDSNRLTGGWPPTLVLPATTVLRVHNNALSDPLNPSLLSTQLPRIRILSLQSNQISGGLPVEWAAPGAAAELSELYLQNNTLRGGLPDFWGNPTAFPGLGTLNLDNNTLGWTLPVAWGQPGSFPVLSNLHLSNTSLSGELPSSWTTPGALKSLEFIDVSGNTLSGAVDNWAGMAQLQRAVVRPGNPDLCFATREDLNDVRLPVQLCTAEDSSCLLAQPRLPLCGEVAPSAEPPAAAVVTPSGAESGGSFPVVAVAVPLGVGIPLAFAVGAGLVVWRRRSHRSAQTAASKRRLDALSAHPFDTFEGQRRMTSPFASNAFSSVNAAAVAPVTARSSDETSTTGTPHRSSSSGVMGAIYPPRSSWGSEGVRGSGGGSAFAPAAAALAASPAGSSFGSGASRVRVSVEMQPLSEILRRSASDAAALSAPEPASVASFAPAISQVRRSLGSRPTQHDTPPTMFPAYSLDLPFSDWEIRPESLQIRHRPDGSDWELGKGGFGRVYKALRDGVQPVAVKILQRSDDPRYGVTEEAFHREVAVLRACRDANIVQFSGAHLGPDKAWIVTEYMKGGDLLANIGAGRVTWARRGRRIATDVAKALVYLHSRRICHFDVKSPNILLARDGTAKLADVGMARFVGRGVASAAGAAGAGGTLAWAAPEVLWGARCTEKADIYSYGIVLWEICSGERPVRGQLRDVEVPEECPAEVRELMLECLETRPAARPSAQQIVERLQALPRATPEAAAAAAAVTSRRTSNETAASPPGQS